MFKFVQNKKYLVKEVDAKIAKKIIKKFHYSHKCVSNSKLHLGVFLHSGVLVGAMQYGPSMNGYKTTKKLHPSKKCMELNRMVMVDDEPRNSESMAISLGFKYLKKYTSLDYVISFSDGKEGNVGYIYQATNWKYIGYRLSSSFYDLDGDIVHSVTVWHRYKEKHPDRKIKTTNEIVCDNFNNVSIITSKQHLYLFSLRKNIKFQHKSLPYPKKDKEIKIIKRKILKKNGIVCKPPEVIVYSKEVLKSCI